MLKSRLEQYHEEFDQDYKEDQETIKKPKKLNMKVFKKYSLRISIVIIFALILFIVAVYVFYENIHLFLMYRVDFINVILSRRIEIFKISYYAKEIIADGSNQGLSERFSNFTVFPELIELLNSSDAEINVLRRVLLTPEIKSNMPSSVFNIQYETVPNTTVFLHYGACAGFNFLRKEYSYLTSNTGSGHAQLNNYLTNLNTLANIYIKLITISNTDSKSQINTELNILIYFVVGCLIFLFLLTFGYFIPYFSKEQKLLENIEMVIKIFSF